MNGYTISIIKRQHTYAEARAVQALENGFLSAMSREYHAQCVMITVPQMVILSVVPDEDHHNDMFVMYSEYVAPPCLN